MKTLKDLKAIDFEPLETCISNIIGHPVKFQIDIRLRNNEMYIEIQSQNLSHRRVSGVMSICYDKLVINNFGGKYLIDTDKYWMPIAFAWRYNNGGNNCYPFCDVYYVFETGKWKLLE